MKKFLSILYMAVTLLTISCERPEMDSEVIEYGRPVNITLKYTTPRMAVQTRLAESEESKVNDLYVFLFDATSNKHEKVYDRYYSQGDLKTGITAANHNAAGIISLEGVPTGRYQIRAVANIRGGYMTEDLMGKLEEVDNLEQLNQLAASLSEPGSVERVMPSLFMSGVYNAGTDNSDHANPDEAVIKGNGQLDGFIHLRRADSKIKFILKKANDKIKKFEPVSWQVFNVPETVPVFEQEEVNSAIISKYQTSSLKDRNAFDQHTHGEVSFEFYLPENKQTPQKMITDVKEGKAYYERERKETDSDTDGNGIKPFKYAPQNATYVEICANMEIEMGEGDSKYTRTAEVKYTVHLGYCIGETDADKANDWNSLRNTKYTYIINVQGVDKIVVEAERSEEVQPGAEGIVMDPIGGEEITVDAHYATFNIALTRADISKMKYLIRTPFDTYEENAGTETGRVGRLIANSKPFDEREEDCTWIKFAETENMETLVNYADTRDTETEANNENKTWLMNVDELKAEYSKESFGVAKENEVLYFTVFVNENVYTQKRPIEYVNKEPRELTLFTSGNISEDGNSIYIKGKYKFRQRSIQSYYNGRSKSMLGVEHSDETKGYNLTWSVTSPTKTEYENWSKSNGWSNVARGDKGKTFNGLVGKNWADYAELTHPDGKRYKTFQMKQVAGGPRQKGLQEEDNNSNDYYEILYACLSRNRDNDRDGVIDADELRWYLPAQDQYQQIFMGGVALEHPLFDASTITDKDREGAVWRCQNKFHFASSDCYKLFAEQGCSTNTVFWSNESGEPNQNPTAKSKWARNIRCVRNLHVSSNEGTDVSETGISTLPQVPYAHNTSERIISLEYYNESCLRNTFISGGGFLAAHDIFDYTKNSPYKKFQYAENYREKNGLTFSTWKSIVETNGECKDYTEAADGSDRGTWRIPNQRELVLIWMELNKIHADRSVLSASSDRFIKERYAGTGDVVQMPDISGNYAIIPVRDIE